LHKPSLTCQPQYRTTPHGTQTTNKQQTKRIPPPPKFMNNNVPFGERKELIIGVKVSSRGTHDIYINALVGLGLDLL
jgi:hypothetical protein